MASVDHAFRIVDIAQRLDPLVRSFIFASYNDFPHAKVSFISILLNYIISSVLSAVSCRILLLGKLVRICGISLIYLILLIMELCRTGMIWVMCGTMLFTTN